jgi:RNA polymerase sigma-70 factor (ECF subfamily)
MNNTKLCSLIFKIGSEQDKSAFNDIFDYFAPRIIGYLIGSGSKKEVAEEITQETLSIIWQKSGQFDYKKGNVSTWIFTIARNKRIDRIRKNENPSYNTLDLIDALYSNVENNNIDTRDEVGKMQDQLDKYEKKLIKMNFFEGKSHKIMSRDLEIPIGTVKSKIRKILEKMRNL